MTSYVSIHRTCIAYRYVCSGVQQLLTHLRPQKSLKKTFTAKNVKLLVLYPIHNVQQSKLIMLMNERVDWVRHSQCSRVSESRDEGGGGGGLQVYTTIASKVVYRCNQVIKSQTGRLPPPHPRVKVSIVGSLRDREVACSASDRQGSNFEYCVWRTVSSQSSHHPQEVLLAQFNLYVHKGGLKPDSFHFSYNYGLPSRAQPIRCVASMSF